MKTKFYICFALCVLVILGIFSIILPCIESITTRPLQSGIIGQPSIFCEKKPSIRSSVDQILSTDQNIFLLYKEIGVVQVYTCSGEYQYSISVYCHEKGGFSMAVSAEGDLIINDRKNNLYFFNADGFKSFVAQQDWSNDVKEIDYHSSSRQYRLRGASVVDSSGNVIIARPFLFLLYQSNFSAFIQFFLFLYCLLSQ